MNFKKHTAQTALVCLLIAGVTLAGCKKEEAAMPPETFAPIVQETTDPTGTTPDQIVSLTMIVTEEDFPELQQYTNLQTLDLTGSTCYGAIARYAKNYPQVDVIYTISLGAAEVDPHAAELSLKASDVTFEALLENLQYLEELKSLSLAGITFTPEQVTQLQEAYPELSISYTVPMLGNEIPSDTETLDLSKLSPDLVPEAAKALALLENLKTVELMDGKATNLSKADVKILVDAAPEAIFHYTFQLFGKTISTNDEEVEFNKVKIGNEGEAELREALAIMTGCKSFRVIDCGVDYEILAKIREDNPRTKLVWRVQFGKYSAMTDTDTIRAVKNVFDDTCFNLRYCNEVKYMDLGHNETLSDLSFVGFMPELEILIVSGCAVKDLSGFENCKKLKFLELAYCGKLQDISPLAGCESLTDLNISYTKVSDLMPLDGLPLEHLMSVHSWVQPKEQTTFKEIHPDCWSQFYAAQPYGKGWRYEQDGKTYTPGYTKVREVFDLDSIPQSWIDAENDALKNKK